MSATRWKLFLTMLALLASVLWLAALNLPSSELQLIACDVGQGDAFLIIQGQTQILLDGGPDNKVLDCLARHLPFWDKTLELVVLSHPESDHLTGLIEVARQYQIQSYLATSLENSTQSYQVLKNTLGGQDISTIDPASTTSLRVGKISLDILHPSSAFLAQYLNPDPSQTISSALDPNDFSIVIQLRYADFDALFTGDIGPEITHLLVSSGKLSDVEFLKVPHHGSKNGLTAELLEATTPEVAVISVGKNQWGHPHPEVLSLLESAGIQVFRTDQGEVELSTDGHTLYLL